MCGLASNEYTKLFLSRSNLMADKSLKYLVPATDSWRELNPDTTGLAGDEKKSKESEAGAAREALRDMLLSSLQMQNVSVLAGCGTSLKGTANGPSMSNLWKEVEKIKVKIDPTHEALIADIQTIVRFTSVAGVEPNVEEFLSRCQSYLQINNDDTVIKEFVKEANKKILEKCSFVTDGTNLTNHETFLHRLSRRKVRDSRLKVFTTNYDLCFERAAGKNGSVVIDGFSFSQPRIYDPRYFCYDIVRRPRTGEDLGNYLEGVIQLFKLHGSVNWERNDNGEVFENMKPDPEKACLIYPASGKYQQSYIQPHLELVAQYLSTLREPNTCLLVAGFGFNDEHLSEPILSAVKSNPHLRLIVADHNAEKNLLDVTKCSNAWGELNKLAKDGEDIWFINASFGELAKLLPDLRSLTKTERLAKSIKAVVGSHV
jgi:hypothetical protein